MVQDLFDLSGKTVLVTGGVHGISRAIGKVLRQAGIKACNKGTFIGKLKKLKAEFAGTGIDFPNKKNVDEGISQMKRDLGLNQTGLDRH